MINYVNLAGVCVCLCEGLRMKREWIKRAKRALVLLLAVVLIGQVVEWRTVALRASVCPNHTEHDESCGYVAASDGHPCNHEHDDSCYKEVTECTHDHDSSCYEKELDCEEDHDHEDSCYKEKQVCDHTCSEESGCIKKELDCHHEHDASCGYEAPTEGHSCNHSCEQCSGNTSGEDGQNGEQKNPEDEQTGATNPENPEELQPEDSEKKCTCTTLCTSDAINMECPVCGAENAVVDECCKGGQEEEEEKSELTEELRAIRDRIDALPTVEEYRELMERYLELSDEAESTEGDVSSEGEDSEQGSEVLQQISDELEEIEDELDRIAEEVADLLELLFDDDLNLREEYKDLDPAKLLDLYHELFGGIEEYVVVEKHEHNGVEFEPWDDPTSLPQNGNYYLTTDVVLTGTLRSKTLSICLNGHSITTNVDLDRGIIYPEKGSAYELNIYDCQDNRGSISAGGHGRGISINEGTTVNLYGGTIKGGMSSYGGGIYNIGTLNLYGGVIKDNQATTSGGGIYNEFKGTVNLCGDKDVVITGNTASQSGGGIYNDDGTVRLKNAGIIGNTAGGKNSNIALKGRRIELDSSCSKNLRAGIMLLDDSDNSIPGTFTNGDGGLDRYNIQNYFFADDKQYSVRYDVDEEGIALKENAEEPTHTHAWYLNIKNDYRDEKKCDVCVGCGVDGCIYRGPDNSKNMAGAYCEVKVRDCEYTGQPYAGMEITDTLSDFLEVPVSITTKYYEKDGTKELGYVPVKPGQYKVATTFVLSQQIMAQGATNKHTETQYFDIMPKSITIGAVYQQKKEEELGEETESVDSDSDKVVVSGLMSGHRIEGITLIYDKVAKTITPRGGKIVDSDGNDVTANYKITYQEGTLKLVQSLDYSVSLKGWTYGDTAKTPTVTGKSTSGATETIDSGITYTYYKILNTPTASGKYYEETTKSNSGASSNGGVPVFAGSYGIKAEVAEIDSESKKRNPGEAVSYFEIGKRPLRIMAVDQSVKAGEEIATGTDRVNADNGSDPADGGAAYAPGDSLDRITLTGTSTAAAMKYGTITPSQAVIKNSDDSERTNNYSITYVNGELTVTRKELSSLTVDIDGWTYGDTPNQPVVTGNDSGGTETYTYYRRNGSSVSPTSPETDGAEEAGGAPKYAGDYQLKVEVAETSAYSSKSVEKDFSITQRDTTVTALPQTVKAGSSIVKTLDQVSVSNLSSGDTVSSVTLTSTSTASVTTGGEITPSNVKVVSRSGKDVTSNYNISYNKGKLTVAANPLNLILKMKDWVYGDTPSNPELTGNTGNGTVTYTYFQSNSQTALGRKPSGAGSYVVKAEVAATSTHDASVARTSFKIEKRPVTITANSQIVQVNASINTGANRVSAKGLVGGDSVSDVDLVSSSTADATESGWIRPSNVKIKDKNGNDVTGNYAPTYKDGTLVVTRKNLSLTVTISGWTYGDSPRTPNVSGDSVDNCTPTYTYCKDYSVKTNRDNSGADKTGGVPKDAGTWILQADIALNSKHNALTGSETFTITRKPITILAKDQTVTKGSKLPTGADNVVVSSLASGDKLSAITLSGSTSSVTGNGTVKPSGAKIVDRYGRDVTACYQITYQDGRLTVKESSSGGKSSGGSSGGGGSSGTTATGNTQTTPQQPAQPVLPEQPPVEEPVAEPEQPQQSQGNTQIQQPAEPEVMPQQEPVVTPPSDVEPKITGNVKVTVETAGHAKQGTEYEPVVSGINATLVTDTEAVLEATLETEEKQEVQNGTDAEVRLLVTRLDDEGDDVPEDARAQIEKMVGILTEYYKDLKLGGYIDIVVEKKLGSGEWMNVVSTYGNLEIMIEIPEELFHTDSDYVIMRYHDGSCELLNDIDEDGRTITISSDKFSTYAILYAQKEEQKSILPMVIKILFCGAAVLLFLCFVILLRRRREEEK